MTLSIEKGRLFRVCVAVAFSCVLARASHAQNDPRPDPVVAPAPLANGGASATASTEPAALPRLVCTSTSPERTYCCADTSSSVLLLKSNGTADIGGQTGTTFAKTFSVFF